jgi:hypothetical protein
MATLFERGRNMVARVLPDVWVDETLTFYRRSIGDKYLTGDECHGKRGRLDKRDARVANGVVAAGTMVFLLDASTIDLPPRGRDKIVDADSVEYFINENGVQFVNFDGSFWRCEVTKEQ